MAPFLDDAQPDAPCFLNGQLVPIGQARVSVLDRGFIFGDGVYEVIPFYGGQPLCFDEHMARLSRSLEAVRMPNPMSAPEWRETARQLLATRADALTLPQLLYLQVTRGVAPRDHAMPEGLKPTVFAMLSPMRLIPQQVRAVGVACVSAEDFRWRKAHIKSTSLLGAVLARQISVDAGAAETVMFRDGWLSEGASSNVWVVHAGQVFGPPRDERVLAGIRYGLIERLCAEAGIPFALRPLTRGEVDAADELLLSSAGKEVLAVTSLDGRAVGDGRPGPIYHRLYAGYQLAKKAAASTEPSCS